jgi:uncharacterized protein (DUF58 family)
MIVPRTRLIVILAVALLPLAMASAWRPALTPLAWAAALLTAAAAALDAALAGRRLEGVAVVVAEVVRLTVDRPAEVVVRIAKRQKPGLRLRVALALPRQIVTDQEISEIVLAADQEAMTILWPCRATRRGEFHLGRCDLETGSRAGLWGIRRRYNLDSAIRVYPNLVGGRDRLRGLFRRREWGLRAQRRVGKGREFEQLRDYLPGDSFEDIDWKATARRRHPVTRIYQVEQAQEIYLVLDASRLSTRSAAYVIERRGQARDGTAEAETTIFDHYVTAALVMAVVADQMSDRFGLLIFSDKPETFVKAGRGKAHYNACRDALYTRMPRPVAPDFDELFTFIGTNLRKRSLLVFLTGLDDPVVGDGFIHAMPLAARQHLLMVNMFRPPGAHPLFSSADVHGVQGIYQHLVGHMLWESLSETRRRLKQHGVGFTLLNKDQLCSQLVSQYLQVKQRQVL